MGNCESQSMLEHACTPVLGRLGPVTELRMVNSIWLRDYQGLFDFQSKEIRKQLLSLQDCGIVFKEGKNKYARNGKQSDFSPEMMKNALFEVVKRSNYYKIQPIMIDQEQYTTQTLLWLAVKSAPQQRYPLKEKDVLKLGKLKIKVREIVPYQGSSQPILDFNSIKTQKKIYEDVRYHEDENQQFLNIKEDPHNDIVSIATENEQTCRVCLEPGEQTNPLICPCKCTGSVRYIHLSCLRIWLGKQLKMTKTQHVISIKWAPLQCEMCKSAYKYRIYLDNKKYYTVEIPRPAKPYIVFEIPKKNAEYSKVFHFISMSQTSKLTIGRKKEIDIKLAQDISVSRHHANLLYDFEGKRFLLEDNRSKFGTLVQVKRNMLVNPYHRGITLQLSGELFTFQTNRGEGPIPDYYDEPSYLNVVEKGDNAEEEESEDNHEEDDDYDGQNEEVPQAPTNVLIANHSNVSEAHSMPAIPEPQAHLEEVLHHESAASQNQSGLNASNLQPLPQPVAVVVNPAPPEEEPVPPPSSNPISNIQVQNLDS